jgi:hypothetical protein
MHINRLLAGHDARLSGRAGMATCQMKEGGGCVATALLNGVVYLEPAKPSGEQEDRNCVVVSEFACQP